MDQWIKEARAPHVSCKRKRKELYEPRRGELFDHRLTNMDHGKNNTSRPTRASQPKPHPAKADEDGKPTKPKDQPTIDGPFAEDNTHARVGRFGPAARFDSIRDNLNEFKEAAMALESVDR